MLYSWKILLAGVLLVGGCKADTIERYPYHTHEDDDDDDDIDLDWDFDGDVDLNADADLDFDVDVDVNADFDIASRIGDAFDKVTDATRGSIVISNDPHRSTYTKNPTDRPTRTLRPVRTTRPRRATRPTRTAQPTTRPTRPTRPTTQPTRTPRPTTQPTRPTRPTTQPTRTPRPTRTRNNNGDDSTRKDNAGDNTNTSGNDNTSGSGGDGDSGEQLLNVEVGELFHLAATGVRTTLAVEDEAGNTVQGVLLRLDSSSLRKLFLVRKLDEHNLVVRSTSSTRRITLTGRESSVDWKLEHEGAKVTLDIEGGLVLDHLSANVAVKLHLVTVSGTRLVSTARTANIALRDGRGSVTFVLQGTDAELSFSSGCYRWGVESLSSNRVMFGDEFGHRCR